MIKNITYKKKQYPIRVGYRALKMFKAETGISLDKVGAEDEEQDLAIYETLLFHSMVSGAKAMEVEMPFKKEEMEDLLDECLFEFIELIPQFFPDDKLGKAQPNRAQKRERKK